MSLTQNLTDNHAHVSALLHELNQAIAGGSIQLFEDNQLEIITEFLVGSVAQNIQSSFCRTISDNLISKIPKNAILTSESLELLTVLNGTLKLEKFESLVHWLNVSSETKPIKLDHILATLAILLKGRPEYSSKLGSVFDKIFTLLSTCPSSFYGETMKHLVELKQLLPHFNDQHQKDLEEFIQEMEDLVNRSREATANELDDIVLNKPL